MNWNDPPEAEAAAMPADTPTLFKRLIDVFFSPARVMEVLARDPRWFWALLSVAFLTTFMAWLNLDAIVAQALEGARAAEGWDESQAGVVETVTRIGAIVVPLFGTAVFTVFFAFLYWLIFRIMGDQGGFKHWLAIVSHVGIIGAVLGIVTTLAMGSQSLLEGGDQVSIGMFLASVLEEGFVLSFLNGLSLPAIWGSIVTALGARAVAGGERSMADALAVTLGVMLVVVAVSAGIGTLLGGFGGAGS